MTQVRVLSTEAAQAWFDALPPAWRVRTLAPTFARADANRAAGLECVHVGFELEGARWLHSVHLRGAATGERGALSPYGYGGPVATHDDPTFVRTAWAAYQHWARAEGLLAEFARFHPEAPSERLFGGENTANRETISVDLTVDDLEAGFNTLARRKIRRAAAARVRWSTAREDWRAWGAFYRAAMQAMGAQPRYLFGDGYFAAIAQVEGVALCILEDDAEWLSGGVYLFGARVAEYHLGASSARGHAGGTAYRLQHEAALEGRRRGLATLYLGGGITPVPDDPLFFYKRSFSRRTRTFHTGWAVHRPEDYAAYVGRHGGDEAAARHNLLFA